MFFSSSNFFYSIITHILHLSHLGYQKYTENVWTVLQIDRYSLVQINLLKPVQFFVHALFRTFLTNYPNAKWWEKHFPNVRSINDAYVEM